ncbi:MAG: hypothetical protein ACK4Q5_19305 [Saprospiraceae bacterium]
MVAQDFVSKDAVLKSIEAMPARIPIDELIDEIVYLHKIELGLQQSKEGKVISLEDFKQKVKTWRREK